ncbi:MAG: family 10 glycosylhydrolase [Nitrospinae bacterium]|nr:family 10 glycosylhydrolase [Nitrospinota bacterium]
MKQLPRTGAPVLLIIALLVYGCFSFRENSLVRFFAPKPFEIGLWVQAEGANRTFDSAEKIKVLVKRACTAGVTDIYAQVYRSGRAWFPTSLADDSPSRRAGQDPLALLLDLASRDEEYGCTIRVHAWINAFALARNKKAPVIRELGKDAVLKDQYGRSLLEYPLSGKPEWAKGFGLGTPGIFLDPGNPGVRRRIIDVAAHLVRNYPRLAGIHLDFIRYPYALPISPGSGFSPRLDFGYNEASVARFEQETRKTAPRAGASVRRADAAAWDQWRRAQVTEAVRGVYETTRGLRNQVIVSTAVLPWAERAYLSAFQDWRGWLESGFLDKAVVMNYSRDEHLAAQISRSALAARRVKTPNPRAPKVVIGLGAYLFTKRAEDLWLEWRAAREAGADGVALFSYDQMVGNEAMWQFPVR